MEPKKFILSTPYAKHLSPNAFPPLTVECLLEKVQWVKHSLLSSRNQLSRV